MAPKRVWIVGAGFSRSLGAPLLQDLLSPAAEMAIGAQFGDVLPPDETHPVFLLFHYGIAFAEGLPRRVALNPRRPSGVRRWRDAEEFLEILDLACDDDRRAEELRLLWLAARAQTWGRTPDTIDVHEFRRCAKRVIAASCSAFIEGITAEIALKRERWAPYLEWLKRLRQNDTIISFNYDRVIELLAPKVGNNLWGVHVRGIDSSIQVKDDAEEARLAGLPLLLKLHGSVDWVVVSDARVDRHEWSRERLRPPNVPAIATPGPEKMGMAEEFFESLWTTAEARLKAAHEVYILGFRFPESDAHPREKLLTALRANQVSNLKVHVVLGPDVVGRDSRRVLELLRWTLRARVLTDGSAYIPADERGIIAHPLYVEDFLTVWSGAIAIPYTS